MKQYCILCNKSISLFGKIISDDRPEGKICFACSEKIKAILSLYDKMESCYTVDQLKIILSNYPTAKAYIDGLASEMKDYDDDVKEAEKSIKDLNSEIKKNDRDIDFRKFEFKSEVKDIKKKYISTGGTKQEVTIVERYFELIEHGRNSDAKDLYSSFSRYMCELVGLIEESEKYLNRRLLVVTKEKDVNLLFRRLSDNILETATFFKNLSVFAYKTLHIPDEYEFFGFYGKIISNDNNTVNQELTSKDTFIKDILSNYLYPWPKTLSR